MQVWDFSGCGEKKNIFFGTSVTLIAPFTVRRTAAGCAALAQQATSLMSGNETTFQEGHLGVLICLYFIIYIFSSLQSTIAAIAVTVMAMPN
jgi:hypothetical protein